MTERAGHLRVVEGGGETPPPPGPDDPFEDWQLYEAFADPESDAHRLFATYRRLQAHRKPERDYGFAGFAREYAKRLTAEAHVADRAELVALLADVGIHGRDCHHVIWDDARPRQLHLWPEGDRWGETPPLHVWNATSPARTYTVCGALVTNHFLHQRAGRGEWAAYYRDFELVRQAEAARRAGTEGPRYTYADEKDARRICPGCAVAVADLPECRENENSAPPEWWFAPVLAEAAPAIAEQLDRDTAIASLAKLQAVAAKAYRNAAGEWLARRLKGDAEAALRRLFGQDLRDTGRSRNGAVYTVYDELEVLAQRAAKRLPHELLSEADWRRLVKPYLPGAPARDMDGKDWYSDAPARRFPADVRARIQAVVSAGRRRR